MATFKGNSQRAVILCIIHLMTVLGLDPKFHVAVQNVTIVEGQNAVLPCEIDNLGKHKVTWVDPSLMTVTMEDRTVIDDTRFVINRGYLKQWNLFINQVKWEDQGIYRCTVNTLPPKHKQVNLHVKVPPKIRDDVSSDDQIVREGDTVLLTCNVTGVPYPEVTWYRKEAESPSAIREAIPNGQGEQIIIRNVTRYCDYYYECKASNGVDPDDLRRMKVTVEYPPDVRLNNKKLKQSLGKDTVLVCEVSAYPQGQMHWEKDGQVIASSNKKHRLMPTETGRKQFSLRLEIDKLEQSDYGQYKCVASNTLGKSSKTMQLAELLPKKPKVTTPTPVIIFEPLTTRFPPSQGKQTQPNRGKNNHQPNPGHTRDDNHEIISQQINDNGQTSLRSSPMVMSIFITIIIFTMV